MKSAGHPDILSKKMLMTLGARLGGALLRKTRFLCLMALPFVLGSCAINNPSYRPPEPVDLRSELIKISDTLPENQLGAPFVQIALEALADGKYVVAQKAFGRALKFDPTNSQLHFLNGLTYHLRAKAGDSSQREFAGVGYKLALQYDPANYWAAYQMGQLNFSDNNYADAQDAFAYSLLYAPDDPRLLKALATASYYAQDLVTARSAIDRAWQVAPDDAKILELSSMINAAVGNLDTARQDLSTFRKVGTPYQLRRVKHVETRLNDWHRFHQSGVVEQAQTIDTSDVLGTADSTIGVAPDASTGDGTGSAENGDAGAPTPSKTKMAMVDVVIIRSEERLVTGKGVNLLSGLSATLSGVTAQLNSVRTVNSATAGNNTLVNTFTYNPQLSVSATYSLNIFNDNNDHNEVIARPSLIALDGEASEFFTGAVFHVQLTGVAGSAGTVTDVPVGIKLNVTPTFIDAGTIKLKVDAARAFIEDRSSQIGFSNFAQVTKTLVTANVVLNFDETLIISGLSEKETEAVKDGVPFLRDIPGVQYLFSREDTLDFTKSVLILMTPRKPTYTLADGTPKLNKPKRGAAKKPQPSLEELKQNPNWMKPTSNIDAVFEHMKSYRFFREFRNGDVAMENWDEPDGLSARIKRAVGFIYY